ncbi:NACHT and WD repeat domain-containing protein 2 [Conger conger]|uniref:NACHT and WD repeat domain-containing protein 2 n=1 Tax=Conger conger TaxID=82655 RepID=UPI002A5AA69B|nr:NACHT and WD repeat domain-containing protein 2 [Conger conger]
MEYFQSTLVKSCVKVFLCTNPEDSLEERRALREDVFPKVRDYCRRTHGLEFRVIDPYEGLDLQDVLDPRQQQVRLQLLEDCRKTSAGPFLVALVGRQYGNTGLPVQVEVSEFQQVLQTGQQMGMDTQLLEHWYERDENAIPPSFCLIDHPHHDQEMRTIFHTIVTRCIREGSVTSEKAQKYFRSALDRELHFALENRSKEDIARCLCYVYKITRKWHQRKSITDLNVNPNLNAPSEDPLSNLRDHFLPGLVTSCQLQVYTTMSEYELHPGDSPERRRWYTEGLCQQLYTDLLNLIKCTVAKEMHRFECALSQELVQQANLCHIYSSLYRVKCKEVQHVQDYLKQKKTEYPLILFGGPCTGKTVLLAHCASQVHTWLDGRDPVMVVHFINGGNTMEQLLISVCTQLAISYDQPQHQLPWDINLLRKAFTNLLSMASSSSRPLVLILDGLDQIAGADGLQSTRWLPVSLPVNVKLLISTAPRKSGTLRALKALYPQSSLFLEVKSKDGRDCSRMLKDLLLSCNRRITSGQQMHVNKALKECSLPLYVELLHRQVCNWNSSQDITEESITNGVHDNIKMFLAQLEEKHGKELVSKAMCYLTLAKSGITEAELTDILSCENEVLSQYLPAEEVLPYRLRVPEAKVENMLHALRGFLMKRNISGFQVLFWPCRHFPLVIHKLYLSSAEIVRETHNTLANYFSGQWAYGRAMPMLISQEHVTQTEHLSTSGVTCKAYIDRQIPGQPWVFDSSSKQMDVNVRKLMELPFHLKKSSRLEELVREVMMSPGFHQGMLRVGHLDDLVSDLKETSKVMSSRELGFLARIVQDAACMLRDSPSGLTTVMQAKLFPFLNVLPELESYAKQIYQEGVRTQGVNVLWSPVSPVLSTCWTPPFATPIMEVLDTQCDMLVMILHDSSIWVWNENFVGGYTPFHLSDLSISNITSEGNFLLLSTKCGRILLYHLKEPLNICELDTDGSVPSSPTDPDFTPGGFLVTENWIILRYKCKTYIQIFDINTGIKLMELHCHHNVTCMSYSYEGQFLLCGQDKGTVSIFDLQDNIHLCTCTGSMETSIMNVLCCEEKHLMVCVDKTGNVFVWNISPITKPKLTKELSSTNDQEEVLNTEHSVENSTFLVCKRHQIVLWDTHKWTVDDQFKAPQEKTFIQAVLSKEGLLIIACLDNCPFLLVWKRTTGQCVLSLNIGDSKAVKLLKMGQTLLAVSANGIISTWDMDFIWSASVISKTGVKVEKLVMESTGEHFYTIDGTELVWKWHTFSNKAEGRFLHNGPVDTFTLSMDCKQLVAASSGDIYVWQTATGENLHRIHRSHASTLLITPKGNLAVSLCQHDLSTVWNLKSGHVVCNVNLHLKNAVISPESTFILGLHNSDLLAVSLWSGYVSKRFSCSGLAKVIAFQPLLDYPDYVVLITISGNLYTWKVTEETVCKHVNLPGAPLIKPELFQLSSDGHYALLSIAGATINILDTINGKLCSLQAEGDILMVCLDMAGRYVLFISNAENPDDCNCDLHSQPVLSAVRIATGKTVGSFYLCKVPSTLSLSENLCAYVGFVDGSVGVYAISDAAESSLMVGKCLRSIGQKPHFCEEPHCWLPLEKPNITWIDPHFE